MSRRPLAQVEIVRPIEFVDALLQLQGLLGQYVNVEVTESPHFFGCQIEGDLDRVVTLPPDNTSIFVEVGDSCFFLDPEPVKAYVPAANPAAVEFRHERGPVIIIEPKELKEIGGRPAELATVFGLNLQMLRARAGLSRAELGVRSVLLSPEAIKNLEQGARLPSLDTCIKLAAALGVSVSELLDGLE